MTDTAISALPAASTLTGAEIIPLVQSGVTSRSTVTDVLTNPILTTAARVAGSTNTLKITADYAGTTGVPAGVLVGTTGASNVTLVADQASGTAGKGVTISAYSGGAWFRGIDYSNRSGTPYLLLQQDGGNVGVGMTPSSHLFAVNTTGYFGTSIDLGHASDTTLARASAGDVSIEGNIIYRAGGTDVPVTDGGTGASTASGARTNLGLVIGTDVQAYDAELAAIAGLTSSSNRVPRFTGSGTADLLTFDTDGTLSSNSDTALASQKAVKTYVDQIIASQDAMVFKGVIDCSANPNYPAADRGHTYRVSVAGKIGGASGTNVEVGDILLCLTDGTSSGTQAAVGTSWSIAQANLDGAVIGPSSVTDSNFAQFDGTSGKLIKGGLSLDTDGTLSANSATRVPSQSAVKTYAQPLDATLTALAGVTTAADKLIYATGVDTFATTDLTVAARSILDDTSVGAIATTLGLGTGNSPQFTGIELGNASDTTLTRASAGDMNIEGNIVYRAGGTDVPVADGGTGRSTGVTAYSLIATGTTATGAQQTLANGATTEILVGGGASALPVWTTATGSGAPVRATSPSLTTPAIGAATGTSLILTGTSANTLTAGASGSTNPVFQVDASTASVATGIKITGAAAAARVALAAISSGTDEGLSIDAKGAGTIRLGATSTGAIEFSRNIVPTSSDGSALGTTSLMWADLFLASGGVINWNNGNVTLTHAAGALTVAGASTFSLGTSAAFTTGTIELGAASDTTLARSGAGAVTIEGVPIVTTTATQTLTNKTLGGTQNIAGSTDTLTILPDYAGATGLPAGLLITTAGASNFTFASDSSGGTAGKGVTISAYSGGAWFRGLAYANRAGTPYLLLQQDGGFVGIGLTTPTTEFHCIGRGYFSTGCYIGSIASTNTLINNASTGAGTTTLYIGNSSINVTSDIRLKENVADTAIDALATVQALRVVDYTWNDPSDTSWNNKNVRGKWTGLIAQEAIEHVPWAINAPRDPDTLQPLPDAKDEEGNDQYWFMEYQHIVPVLIRAIQQQQEQISALRRSMRGVG